MGEAPAPVANELTLTAAGLSDVGRRRKHNEDVIVVYRDLALFAVCDGAGGHDSGDVAAATAAETMTQYIQASASRGERPAFDRFGLAADARRLATAMHRANAAVIARAKAMGSKKGMGSVAVAALFTRDAALVHVAHVGDSRLYRLRAGNLEQLTNDHSVLNDVVEQRPDIEDDLLARVPRNAVTRALGVDEALRVPCRSYEVVDSDRYLLCSDGLTGPVAVPAIAEILRTGVPPDQTVAMLVDAALERGAPDNVSAIVIDCASPRHVALPISSATPTDRDSQPELLILGVEDVSVEVGDIVDDEEVAQLLASLPKGS